MKITVKIDKKTVEAANMVMNNIINVGIVCTVVTIVGIGITAIVMRKKNKKADDIKRVEDEKFSKIIKDGQDSVEKRIKEFNEKNK